jgi:hypothetical protein
MVLEASKIQTGGVIMGITAREESGGSDIELLAAGIHGAVCVGMVHIGHINNPVYEKNEDKLAVLWAMPDQRIEIEKDGEKVEAPRFISRIFTKSLHKKSSLRPFLELWRGSEYTQGELEKGVDLSKIIGVSCKLQIMHKTKEDRTYANIASIQPDSGKVDYDEVDPIYFSWEDEYKGVPENVPKWMKGMIEDSSEYGDMVANEMADNTPDIPDEPPWEEEKEETNF